MSDSSDSKKINFKIYPQQIYDKKILELKKVRKILPPKEVTKITRELFNFPMIFGMVMGKEELNSFPIYRARAIKKGETIDENDLSQFSYPPESKCRRLRCNAKGKQVLYTAGDPNTAIYEIKKQIIPRSTTVYLSEWGIKELSFEPAMHMVFHGLPEGDDTHSSIFASACKRSWNSSIQDLPKEAATNLHYYLKAFQELFTYPTPRYYHLSSAYIYDIFENMDGIIDPKGIRISMPIIAYPSVAKDKRTANFVFKKEFVDQHLFIKYVDKVIVTTLKDGTVAYNPIARGIVTDGKITWSPYQIKVSSSEYGWAFLSANKQIGQDLEKVDINEPILKKGWKQKVSVNQYLTENGISFRTLIDGVKQMTKGDANTDLIEPPKTEMMSFFNVNENIYWNNKQIKQIGFPFSYKIGYQL